MPVYIIYKSLRLYSQWCPKNIIKGVVYNGTKTGWTDQNCFFDYLQKLFIPNTKHLARPLLLICDDHCSHLSLRAVRMAIEHGVHLLALPSHSTRILQPLDVYTLKYVKQEWKKLVWERNKTTSTKMEKSDFVQLFAKLYEYALIPAHCSTAFAKSGIFPYDPRAVKRDKIIKHALASTMTPSELPIKKFPNELNTEPCFNNEPVIQRSTLTRSNLIPCLINSYTKLIL